MRVIRRARTVSARLERIGALPVFSELERASANLARLSAASEELQALAIRAALAVARIRALIAAIRRYLPSSS